MTDSFHRPVHITMLGDSLTAGFGLVRSSSLPSRLQAHLKRLGVATLIHNAGVSGDTTADGLRRLSRDVPPDTQLCIVALGANDLMQGVPTDRMQANLDAILTGLRDRSVPVLLCGMRAPPWLGFYAIAFEKVFRDVVRQHRAEFDPFLLEGVALNPRYVLPDRLHPNADGVELMAKRLAPKVREALMIHGLLTPAHGEV